MRQYVWRGKLDDCLVSDCSVIERVYTQFSLTFDWDDCVSPDPNKSISLMFVVVVHHVLVLCMEAKWEHGLEGTVRFLMLSFRFFLLPRASYNNAAARPRLRLPYQRLQLRW
jgi:hypothetical protein